MTTYTRRAVLGQLSTLIASPAIAQRPWPARKISLIVGFPAGGPIDILSRIIAESLSNQLGQQVVVENKAGATGTVAAGVVARAAPDGYTLTMLSGTFAASAAMFRKLPYDPVNDFSWISTVAEFPYLIVTYPEHPCRTIPELLTTARAASNPLQFGTSGNGSVQHLSGELLARTTNVKLQHVPYRGGAPAITDLLGKRLDFVIDQPAALMEYVRDGQLRVLAVTSDNRFFALPEVATISEAGFPQYAVSSWQGVVAPAGLAAAIQERLSKALTETLADQKVVEKLHVFGYEPKASSADTFKARVASDVTTWTKLVNDAHLELL